MTHRRWMIAVALGVLASSTATAQEAAPATSAAKQQARADLARQIRIAGGNPENALMQLDQPGSDPNQGPNLRQTLDDGIAAMTVLRTTAKRRR